MLQAHQRLGDFEIIRLLGKGGMGEVYEALQFNPERRVALKVLCPWLAGNDEALERFLREAQVPAQLDHPGVVRIIASGKADGIAYYAMQLVRGVSLAELMGHAKTPQPETASYRDRADNESDRPTLPFGAAGAATPQPSGLPPVVEEYRVSRYNTLARIGVQAARALASAHQQGFLHRDIKPSNLMVDHHNHVYLLDFGLTRALDSGVASRAGTVIGTPWYMSPEQAHGLPVDARTDIFSLGVTLFELATRGQGPYTAHRDDSNTVLLQVRAGAQRSLRELAPDIPPELERILRRAIDLRPEERYQSAENLARDLEHFLGQCTSPIPASPRPRARAGHAALVMGLLVTVLLAVLIGQVLFRDRPDTSGNTANSSDTEFFKRERPQQVRVRLLREDGQPVLHRVMLGQGSFTALPTQLKLLSLADLRPTLLALDAPNVRSFEFSVELLMSPQQKIVENEAGIFWGWHHPAGDPLARARFLAAHLDRRPVLKDQNGRLYVGSWMFLDARNGQGGIHEQSLRPLPKGEGWIPLAAAPPGFDGWHTIRVRVTGNKCSVSIDKEPPREFDMAWLTQNDAWIKNYSLSLRGAVGVWAQNGTASFRNATIMALPDGED